MFALVEYYYVVEDFCVSCPSSMTLSWSLLLAAPVFVDHKNVHTIEVVALVETAQKLWQEVSTPPWHLGSLK